MSIGILGLLFTPASALVLLVCDHSDQFYDIWKQAFAISEQAHRTVLWASSLVLNEQGSYKHAAVGSFRYV